MLPTHKLHHAVVLAEQRNFRKAAKELNLTQPALSRSIQSLERALGVPLFDRSRSAIELTTVGRLVVDRAREILMGVAELEHEIELLHGLGAGTLEVCLGPYPSALSGQPAVARLLADHPEIQCHVRVAGFSGIAENVEAGLCEVGVADLGIPSEHGLVTELLNDTQVYFFARPQHPLAARKRPALEDMSRYPWAGIRAPARMNAYLPADGGRAGRWDRRSGEFVPALEIDTVSDVLALARESDVLAIATFTMVEEDLAEGQLVVVRFAPRWLRLCYGFISRPNHTPSPATLRFMEIVREIEADLEARETTLRTRYLR